MASPVTRTVEGGIAMLRIDHPPVNAMAQPVREALLAAVQAAAAEVSIHGLLIHGAGRCFVAGADLREFDAAPGAPLLNDVVLAIEALPKPGLAAVHGMAFGGGLERDLACHYRCASEESQLAFPEI